MDKAQWIQQWIIAFTANYAALHYDNNCMVGWGKNEGFVHPCDVWHLAEQAYRIYNDRAMGNLNWDELRTIKKKKDE